jgi:hypothetical protein
MNRIKLSDENSLTQTGANSVFAQTILDVAKRKPHLLFGEGIEPYIIE